MGSFNYSVTSKVKDKDLSESSLKIWMFFILLITRFFFNILQTVLKLFLNFGGILNEFYKLSREAEILTGGLDSRDCRASCRIGQSLAAN